MNKYNSLEKNIQIDFTKVSSSYIIFIIWTIATIYFFYICVKIYITNKVPTSTTYILLIAGCYSIYYIYINIYKYITLPNFFDFDK